MTQEPGRTDSGGEAVLEARVRRGQLQKELEDLSLLLTCHGLSVPLPGPEQQAVAVKADHRFLSRRLGDSITRLEPGDQPPAHGCSLFLHGTALLGYSLHPAL